MIDIEKEKYLFEAWARPRMASPKIGDDGSWQFEWVEDGLGKFGYYGQKLSKMWDSWQARAALQHATVADEAMQPQEWQPIKTAPKDGTQILAKLLDSDSCYVIEWADASKGIRLEAGEGVGWHMGWDGYFFGPHEQPTKWMYIPDESQLSDEIQNLIAKAEFVVIDYHREFKRGELPNVDDLEDAIAAIKEKKA